MASENNNKNTASDKESSLPKGNEPWLTIIIFYTFVAYLLWNLISSPVEDIEVLVTDKNGTPGIVVTIFDASTDEVVREETLIIQEYSKVQLRVKKIRNLS